ncbi:MAG: hypothetical protein JNL11_06565 [Bdellovibrionaceae bacterium]|nr:hypothetical protein [Pseudobdellovibrionaceae bacterium]
MDEDHLEKQLNDYWNDFQHNKISKGDLVSLYLLAYHHLFPTPHWLSWNASRKHTLNDIPSYVFPKNDTHWKEHPCFQRIPATLSLGQIMNQSVFKKETLRSNLGLMHVYCHPQTVHLLDYIPSPIELLEMQANGYRCVTLLRTKVWFHHQFDHRRNLRDFVIHDLEHIWQMFENPTLTKAQVRFSNQLLELTRKGHFDFIRTHAEFTKEFDYIISDMNTHPAHTYATLKSLVLRTKNAKYFSPFHATSHEIQSVMQPLDAFID